MRHFLIFLILVFGALFALVNWRKDGASPSSRQAVLRVYAASSFMKPWGPGPILQKEFEKTCGCRVEFFDAGDSLLLLQKLKAEPTLMDLMMGLDQYDLELAHQSSDWRSFGTETLNLYPHIRAVIPRSNLVPFDWGVLAFVFRKSQVPELPRSFEDLLKPQFADQLSLQDPRTSSTGLQFLYWLIQSKGEEKAFAFLRQLSSQVRAWGSSWSMSYGLFQKSQVLGTLAWSTSPIYHKLEEGSDDIVAAEFDGGHLLQLEYMGIPMGCQSCDLAEKFAQYVLSAEGQKIIMEKNYMFPVLEGVRENSSFSGLKDFRLLDVSSVPTQVDRERVLRRWSQQRRGDRI